MKKRSPVGKAPGLGCARRMPESCGRPKGVSDDGNKIEYTSASRRIGASYGRSPGREPFRQDSFSLFFLCFYFSRILYVFSSLLFLLFGALSSLLSEPLFSRDSITGSCACPSSRIRAYTGLTVHCCLLYTSPSPRDRTRSRMPSSA